ncbi:acyl-CoA dehydrogenase family protein [Rhodococcoides yunnanense]|uniref:acyl-CoA dehydrogenase family protein n=1 Tax=Rhodococcoides yunnanense TaxID=278209 RepID=UPI00093295DE|nr:acyl-CoA dehydrogenase family protein [Rhodococcus yunnanensis]
MSYESSTAADAAEREEFREVVRDFLAKASDHDRVRAVVGAAGLPDPKLRDQAAKMGWFGLEIPEEYGGSGGRFADLAILLEESGEATSSLALTSTSVLCAGAVLLAGSDEQKARWLPSLAEGTQLGTAVLSGATATSVGNGAYSIDGVSSEVVDGRSSHLIVVVAEIVSGGGHVVGVVRREAAGVSVRARPMLDATRPLDVVSFDGTALESADILATGDDADRLITALSNRAAVATAADSLGIGRRVLSMTVAYASQREQFGRPIGSFQAVKHQAADVHVDNEVSSGLVGAAADAIDQDSASAHATLRASMAKSFACAAGTRGAGVAVQLHGGIGYTWEHDLHLYLKRATLNEQLFGSGVVHAERVARQVL